MQTHALVIKHLRQNNIVFRHFIYNIVVIEPLMYSIMLLNFVIEQLSTPCSSTQLSE